MTESDGWGRETCMSKKKKKICDIRVVELFAGVGGFRLGLEGTTGRLKGYRTVWSNQWEPSTKVQHASDIYVQRFGSEGHSNKDIATVETSDIPSHDLLVGGFPCQDYSVARTLREATGLVGKKGVLWWQIHRIISEKERQRPRYLFLENVDRLLKSPASQRGRDFAIMLASLADLGYIVEWRVINAADYGMPQRRRRVFILGYRDTTSIYKRINKLDNPFLWVTEKGVLAKAFRILVDRTLENQKFEINGNLIQVTKNFDKNNSKTSPFANAGIMIDRKVYTGKTKSIYRGKPTVLKDMLVPKSEVPPEFYLNEAILDKWRYHKGAKKEPRKSKGGHVYNYSEGPMVFPDPLDKPSRTIVTGEGGSGPSRFKHVIKTSDGRYRRLTPVELEKLCMFPPGHTEGAPDTKRAFIMGNALVVGVVKKIGRELLKQIDSSKKR